MICLEQVKLPIPYTEEQLHQTVARALRVPLREVQRCFVVRRSVDARHKPSLTYVASVAVEVQGEKRFYARYKRYERAKSRIAEWHLPPCNKHVVVVGSGPAGMLAALALAEAGTKPIVVERGASVDRRTAIVQAFRDTGVFDAKCNVQFGEGGAGTFSDGKLNTGTQNPFIATVLGEFVAYGAPPCIAYEAKPHVGTDKLVAVVRGIRERIEALGGQYLFDTQVTDLRIENGRVTGVVIEGAHSGVLDADCVLLGIGHSARDTYRMLATHGIAMEQKPFSVGVRMEHLQSSINLAQYGTETPPFAADYKLSAHLANGRGVYTFCMCPGGTVVTASSENGGVVTNGMSVFARDGVNANAAVLVGVDSADFGEGLFDGMLFQQALEQKAFAVTGRQAALCQTYGDFCNGKVTKHWGRVAPSVRPEPHCADLNDLLPNFVSQALKEGVAVFGKKIKGYDAPDAVLTAPETRSSAPLRILRGDDGQASVLGLYPIGEGAGYAGGITSAAVDGLRAAMRIIGVDHDLA